MAAKAFQQIRKTGADGALLEAGFGWVEHNHDTESLLTEAGWTCILLAIFMYGMAAMWPWPGTVFALAGNAALLGVGVCAVWRMFLSRKRSLIFRSDGALLTPHGTPAHWYRRRIRGHQKHIASIESALRGNHEYYVRIISHGGDLIWVGWHLDEGEALKVAVQLTIALDAMRREASQALSRGTPLHPDMGGAASEIIN